jgi:hypothetical protein
MDGGDVAKTMRMYLMSLNYALKMVKIVHFLFIVFHHNFFFLPYWYLNLGLCS